MRTSLMGGREVCCTRLSASQTYNYNGVAFAGHQSRLFHFQTDPGATANIGTETSHLSTMHQVERLAAVEELQFAACPRFRPGMTLQQVLSVELLSSQLQRPLCICRATAAHSL
eukprot:4739245-Amphidinium_carterae.1